mmetsp:Transcript_42148/g.88107  ORF Transcript_42148/g.88107 Transcript_42148/m.88107 type:complete len:155 (-) Transcript_42148:181-645(-)
MKKLAPAHLPNPAYCNLPSAIPVLRSGCEVSSVAWLPVPLLAQAYHLWQEVGMIRLCPGGPVMSSILSDSGWTSRLCSRGRAVGLLQCRSERVKNGATGKQWNNSKGMNNKSDWSYYGLHFSIKRPDCWANTISNLLLEIRDIANSLFFYHITL